MPEEKPETTQGGLEGLVDQMSKLPQVLEELGGRIKLLEERETERESRPSNSSSGGSQFSLEPLGKAIESMTREFTATIRELASGGAGRAAAAGAGTAAEQKPPEPAPPPPSPAPPPTPAVSRVRELLGTPTMYS